MVNKQTIKLSTSDLKLLVLEALSEKGVGVFPTAPEFDGLPDDLEVTITVTYDTTEIAETEMQKALTEELLTSSAFAQHVISNEMYPEERN